MKINKKNLITYAITVLYLLTANLAMAGTSWGPPPKPSGGVPTDIEGGLLNLINWILGFVSMVAVLIVIWGGVQYLTSAGDENKAENGKKTLTYAFIGLVIAAFAYGIINTIVTKILK